MGAQADRCILHCYSVTRDMLFRGCLPDAQDLLPLCLSIAIDDYSKPVYYVVVINITHGAVNHVEQVIQ